MSQNPTQGAPRADDRRPPRRTSYLASRPGSPPARLVLDGATGARFELRVLPGRIGEPAARRYELRPASGPPAVVSDLLDYHECDCPGFRRDWECPHTRALVALGLVAEARFALTADGGKGVGDGRR